MKKTIITNPRISCKDLWNAFMLERAQYSPNDIPYCKTTALYAPRHLVSYKNAKTLYLKELRNGNKNFHCNSVIHFYIDDQFFDGARNSIWTNPEELLKISAHFDGIITPDFSTYLDFPEPLKIWNTFRMRTLGVWLGDNGQSVINNVRWGPPDTWSYCFDGLPKESIYAIGTVASNLRNPFYRDIFVAGLQHMMDLLNPRSLIIYGSRNLSIFDDLESNGIQIIHFPSDTNSYFEEVKSNEQSIQRTILGN